MGGPFLWIFWGAFAVSLVCSMRSRRRAVRIACFNLAACCLILGVGEGVYLSKARRAARAQAQASPREAGATSGGASHENLDGGGAIALPDDLLGYAPIPNSHIAGRKSKDGALIYDVLYTIDAHGLRRSPPAEEGEDAECILLFGDSFTFGEGVEDDQTTAYVLGTETDGRYHVFNFGYQGYGPHQMLAALESGRVEAVLDCTPKYVIYQAILAHVKRAAGLSSHDHHGPRYRVGIDGEARRDGHFDDPPRLSSADAPRSMLYDRLSRSFLLSELLRGTVGYAEQVDLLVAIVDSARRFVERRWPGSEFHVVFWNERYQLKTLQLERALSRSGLRLHRVGDILPDYLDDKHKYWIAPSDRHPNALAHRRIADYLYGQLVVPQNSCSVPQESTKVTR